MTWRNDSPFTIQGNVAVRWHIRKGIYRYSYSLKSISGQGSSCAPGQTASVRFAYEGDGGFFVATLTLAGAPLKGMELDQKSETVQVEEPED